MLDTLKKVTEETLREIEEEKKVRKTNEMFLLFAMGSQFDHLIKQMLEKIGVFCMVADPKSITAEDVKKVGPIGIISSGGPASVHTDPPPFDDSIFNLGIPMLGICLGFQMWAKHVGASVVSAGKREFNVHALSITDTTAELFHGCDHVTPVLQSHGDIIEPSHMTVLASTENSPVAAGHHEHLWGVQFHPEVTETVFGRQMFENFCFRICGAKDRYPAEKEAERKIAELREQIGDDDVLLALSGGSDSSTVAYLLKEAMKGSKGKIRAVYIKGIDRPDDEEYVIKYFGNQDWLDLKIVDATEDFLTVLKGEIVMKKKRRAMKGIYHDILYGEAKRFGAKFIAQGTLYTDISESGGGYQSGAAKAVIKEHHNVDHDWNDLEELMPLADCVKDGGRNIGRSIGVPEDLLTRHPFPGPGLVVRIEGEVNAQSLAIARKADEIYIEELRKWNLYHAVWQAGAVVTSTTTTCTKGDDAGKGIVIMIWAVWSVNGFTATAADLPTDFLKHVDRRMTNEIREVGATSYRLSGKPPSTIEIG